MSDPKVSEALTKLLCSNGGQLSRTQLSELLELSVEQIDQVLLEEAHRFPVLSEDLVVARSPVRLCTEYMRGQPEEDGCGKLHLCHFHIRGRCWNKKSKCKLGHNIQSEHNLTVLKNNEISLLSKKELKVLLLQNDHSLLPGVCWKNIHEGCDQGDACRKLHVCGFFIKGECYRRDCKFSHNLHDPTLSLILKRSGYTNVNIQNLQMLCVLKNKETLQAREGLRKFVPKARKQTISVYNMGLKAQKPSMSSNDTAYRKTGIQAMNSHWTDNEYYSDKDHWNILEEQPKIFISSKAKGEQGSPHSSNIAGIQALSSHWTDNEYSDEDHWNILEEQPKIFISSKAKVNQNYIFNKKSDLAKIDDVKEICVFNVWDYCKLGINCGEMHYHLPYRWQYLDGTEWKDLSHMEETEKAYSDPSMDRGHLVDFRTMKSGTSEARRLSTASSVTKPSQYSLTTEWLWYWKDETGSWIQYGDMNIKQQSASISSDDLETVYLANPKDVCPFQAGSQSYEINFKEMVQRNLVYKTQREVRRRPQYRSLDDVRQLRRSSNATTAISSKETGVYPSHWDSSALPDIGYKLVNVSPTSTEYMDIRKMFLKTMPHQAVMKIRRIQNPSLWKFFQLQKEQMKKVNKGKNVDERQLFHGTNNSHIQTICNENFDWRICGTNGTMYGKGSYFARDASYSHNYSNPDIGGKRSMFVTRVLVGDFVRGDPTMKRPPYKSNSTNQSYDSCVDTTYNPSIFVVFEKHQIYPEYLMEYAQCQWYEETKVDKTGCCIS
ncbi:protein mono-ADP-ribosyltransferase PARP12 isoform X2 [Bombina bombina]|uniref:protein mono-ADP-ribosyltransferase PARP12 isoform X2 n=1 Tax=Bombina bombina TaxID=8345 RepID=UPI00235B29A2|nr:protein mono-ADP-ribosyltransferase PARP12 isoform X2 [Bombina bombina]